jgi:hypothetical protein
MKKLVCLLLSLMLLCALPFAFAASENRILAVDAALMGLANMNPQVKGGESTDRGCIGLQSAAEGEGFADGYIMFPVEAETAGLYEITVQYAAKAKAGQTRCADLIVNEGERIHLPIEGQPEWTDYVDATVTVELVEGVNTLVLLNVEGFDNSAYKAINVDYIEWNPAAEIPAEVPAE